MSKRHGARDQKRLAKQKSKRQTRLQLLARRNSPDPTVRLQDASRWPVVASLVPEGLWSTGIGNLILARRMPTGQLACAMILLDVFCLGAKNALWKILSAGEFKELCKDAGERFPHQDVPPEYFAKLVYRAVDYAQSIGFAPHPDFRHAVRLLAGIDPSLCPDEFEFGQDGRPHYFSGPSESMDKARAIATRVAALGGLYTLKVGPSDMKDFEKLDEAWDDDIDEDEFEDDEMVPRLSDEF